AVRMEADDARKEANSLLVSENVDLSVSNAPDDRVRRPEVDTNDAHLRKRITIPSAGRQKPLCSANLGGRPFDGDFVAGTPAWRVLRPHLGWPHPDRDASRDDQGRHGAEARRPGRLRPATGALRSTTWTVGRRVRVPRLLLLLSAEAPVPARHRRPERRA